MSGSPIRKKFNPDEDFQKYFNINLLSRETGIQSDKIYNNLKGHYNSFNETDRKEIVNELSPRVKKLFERLGYKVVISKA